MQRGINLKRRLAKRGYRAPVRRLPDDRTREETQVASADRIRGDQINFRDLRRIIGGDPDYEAVTRRFHIPEAALYNMAADTVDRHAAGAHADTVALICDHEDGDPRRYTYRDLSDLSDRFAVFLRGRGVGPGDVVACYCGQGLETAMAHLGAYKLGAIVAPLSQLYGPTAVAHVLGDCAATVIVTQKDLWTRIAEVRQQCPGIGTVVVSGGAEVGELSFEEALETDAEEFTAVVTAADDPALLLYTSGSTGMPKGILHRQNLVRGYLASVSLFYEMEMNDPARVLWTVSDWSWVAGIFNVMLTGWYFGHTVVAGPTRFTPEWAFAFMARHGVTHCFLTPTALKRMAAIDDPPERWPELAIRAIGTGGEPLPGAVLDWAETRLGIPINEFYGLTEVNHLIGNCRRLWPIKPGSMGRPYPGHTIAVIDEDGVPLPDGTLGEIAARDDDPTLFIGYWKQPARTADMRTGRWIRTGDFGYRDADGYFWFKGRNDDLIKSAGYRIGPAEVEDALVRHPAVSEAAVVGSPDAERGQVVKAFVRLIDGHRAGDDLARELQDYVKSNLAFYKYPRRIEFVDAFPLTSTGKINRKELRHREQTALDKVPSPRGPAPIAQRQ
jgi:acetyl-CoA synthetase